MIDMDGDGADACTDTQEWNALTAPRLAFGESPDDTVWWQVKLKPEGYGGCAVYGCAAPAMAEMDGEAYCETHGDLVGLLRIVCEDWSASVDLVAALAMYRAEFEARSDRSLPLPKQERRPAAKRSPTARGEATPYRQFEEAKRARAERLGLDGRNPRHRLLMGHVGQEEMDEMAARAVAPAAKAKDAGPLLVPVGELAAEDLTVDESAA